MFCSRPFGGNDVLESLPIGRRLAFDPDRGRLWIVCRRCERWNLTPLEERWESVEECERLFRATRLRVSTDNVGMARHAEGLELVRIGRPLRPEFAAWRYGDQFGRRRQRAILYGVAGATVVGAVAIGGSVAGITMGPLLAQSGNFVRLWQYGVRPLRLAAPGGELLKLSRGEIESARIVGSGDRWTLTLRKGSARRGRETVFTGDEAERVAGVILTRLNHTGGSRDKVRDAVREIEAAGHPEAFVHGVARGAETPAGKGPLGRLAKLPVSTRLALEMALHEERERRALEGELRGLEVIWRREEEIAAISDDLLVPEAARGRLESMKGRPGAAG
jgi:hypothetical protein